MSRVLLGLVMVTGLGTGCVKTTRFVLDKEGNVTERIETLEPSVVAVYGGPVVYRAPVFYEEPAVVYRQTHYYSPPRHVHHVRTIHVGGRRHHRRCD